MFVCHGYAEHSQWYDKFCEKLCSAESNLICFSHDHLGHGLSEGERATVPNIEWFVDDVIQHVAKVTVGSYRLPFIPNIGNEISTKINCNIFSDEASISKATFLYFRTFYGRFDSTKVRENVIIRKVNSPISLYKIMPYQVRHKYSLSENNTYLFAIGQYNEIRGCLKELY